MVRVRPLDVSDLDALRAFAAATPGVGEAPGRGAVAFYARTGHAFVAETDAGVRGFAFAAAVWDGERPTVRLARLAFGGDDVDAVRAALLEAVTKSAYDAAVYDLVAEVAEDDAATAAWLRQAQWRARPVTTFVRTLGSRGGGDGGG